MVLDINYYAWSWSWRNTRIVKSVIEFPLFYLSFVPLTPLIINSSSNIRTPNILSYFLSFWFRVSVKPNFLPSFFFLSFFFYKKKDQLIGFVLRNFLCD